MATRKHAPHQKSKPQSALPPTRSEAAMGTLVARLVDPATSLAQRDKLLAMLMGKAVAAPVSIERVEQTAGGHEMAEALRGGRTLIGIVEGSKLKIAVRYPESRNAEVESFTRGLFIKVHGKVAGWDPLFERLIVESD
ncbi:MAG: hypothetical protein HUU03_15375 [Planctomycetaceae bacterium]|nr:hypothetical protein [Planctomycetaceae bacterium]HRJ80028.1 hypothetical protein [Planctomycetota bacterium]